ncbi:diaminopimelate epimerase [Nitrosomonas sp. PY1]|uniref:diaminopimelate epimerase n=1 Tax=Nitrosomonas sp. PY1 TaxID=1803906 RepID=UPI001FC7E965|nr:diaminopimelate epimerase [Nitrosomonas sp. PY1]GKS68553.1 diaminopimelate epimerase [Nitrosomonas sp. PY1]
MKLKFTKMHGLGNDFVVLNGIDQTIQLTQPQIRFLADRHFGIGCDQILLVERAQGDADFRYRIFNADGGEVEQCGNGARCFVRYVHDQSLTQQREIRIETLSGIISPKLEDNGNVTVNMGKPIFRPEDIPFLAEKTEKTYPIEINDDLVTISVLSMGNPHAVRIVEDVETAPVDTEGALIESHRVFPKRVNVGYMQIVDRSCIRLRVFERGAGETLACGTGACAAVVAGINLGLLEHRVTVNTRGGKLIIDWQQGDAPVWMSGPAVTVFEGEINLQSIKEIR